MNMNNVVTNSNNNIGFRSAFKKSQRPDIYGCSDSAVLKGISTHVDKLTTKRKNRGRRIGNPAAVCPNSRRAGRKSASLKLLIL